MNAAEHVAEAERLVAKSFDANTPEVAALALQAAQVHATLAFAVVLVPRDETPEPHSAVWCAAREAWDTVESGSRFDDLDVDMQGALAARWQRRHG